MKKYFLIFYLIPILSMSQNLKPYNLQLDSKKSFISYEGRHILHDWVGVNKNVKGIMVIEDEIPKKIALSTSVQDFDSGNSSRDSHALELIESLIHPKITFFSDELNQRDNRLELIGVINFHGIEKKINVNARINQEKTTYLSGNFKIAPSDFDVKLPSFMLSKMEDSIEIVFELFFGKTE